MHEEWQLSQRQLEKCGGEWKNGDKTKQGLSECAPETAKLNALSVSRTCLWSCNCAFKYLADKKDLFRMTNQTVKVTGLTLLSSEDTLYCKSDSP